MVDAKEENDGTTQNDGDDDPYVNPEPPQEIQEIQQADLIGNTMFSKHWLFGLLLKLIEVSSIFGIFAVAVDSR